MNISTKMIAVYVVLIGIVSSALGMVSGYRYASAQMHRDGYVHLEVTRTGTFIIDAGKIYSVSELETEKQFASSIAERRKD